MNIKNYIKNLLIEAATEAFKAGRLPLNPAEMVNIDQNIEIAEPKHETQGDLSTNYAMISASFYKMPPQKIAKAIVDVISQADYIQKIQIAGPGFINFFLSPAAWHPVINLVLEQDKRYGTSNIGNHQRVQVEFVSANPTGPLHVGHGRGAVVGDSIANILTFTGFDVKREYYINDSGRQIRTLGQSVWLRLQEAAGEKINFPEDCYQGSYIRDLADEIIEQKGEQIAQKNQEQGIEICARYAVARILDSIRKDLSDFGVKFDHWFSEQSLYDSGLVSRSIDQFRRENLIYEKDNALWFRTSDFGDEKDRVVVRSNGMTTYFASDIAYHRKKYERGFDKVIDVWGADHHGYIKRIEASVKASGKSKDQFEVILIQLVNLLRGGKPFQMSTRAGQFVTLRNIIDEVGKDAARFMFLSRSHDSGLDFDLDLARQKNNNNPVYYVQYVHARISGILSKAMEDGLTYDVDFRRGLELDRLVDQEEIKLIKIIAGFTDQVQKSALTLRPHLIFTYLMSLASAFHGYYNRYRVISEDSALSKARLSLVLAIKKVIANGLSLLGVTAPDRM